MTRTDAILKAVQRLLETRRAEIDRADDLRSVILDLKFAPGRLDPRTIVDRIERECVSGGR